MNILCKPIRSYGLEYAQTHIVQRVDIVRFRRVLKEAREGKSPLRRGPKMGRPALSKLTASEEPGAPPPVNSQTIKNIEDGLNKDPGIVTVARLVEGLGLTLSSFFAQIEVLKTAATDEQNDPLSGLKGVIGDSSIPSPPTEIERDIYRKIGRMFYAAAAEQHVTKTERASRASTKGRGRR